MAVRYRPRLRDRAGDETIAPIIDPSRFGEEMPKMELSMKTRTTRMSLSDRWSQTVGPFLCWMLVLGWLESSPVVAPAQQIIEVRPISPTVQLLARRLGRWRLEGHVTDMLPAEFESDQPERAQLIGEYGLRDLAFATYRGGDGATVRIELFRMINYVAAYGAYTVERSARAEPVAVGAGGARERDRLWFSNGDYYARLSVVGGVADGADLLELARRLDGRLGRRPSEVPLLVQHLPSAGLVSGTERFIAGPRGLARVRDYNVQRDMFLLTSQGVEAVLAQYRLDGAVSRLMLIEYHTPQLAAAARRRVDEYFQALPEDERARRILKSEGNYLIEATDVDDREAMRAVVDQIKYEPTIIWLKKDPLDYLRGVRGIPYFSTFEWLITTFGFIALMLLIATVAGVLLGVSVFFWRRWRFRYSTSFTDAGGMLRLNLDDLVLPRPEEERRKRLPGPSGKR